MSNNVEIRISAYYSNGAYGRAWGVRQILEFSLDPECGEEMVRFRGIAGTCRRKTGECTLDEFNRLARYEVSLNGNSWQRVGMPDDEELEKEAQLTCDNLQNQV